MPDINDYIRSPENNSKSPEIMDREKALQDWGTEPASRLASQQGLILSEQHWAVIQYLQLYYLENGWPRSSHELTQQLDRAFAEQGGKRYLYSLFPEGPLAQGCRIAGLPVPAGAENRSMGSVQ